MIHELKNKELFEGFTVKAIKTFIGQEGDGYNANLYYKGKKVGMGCDDASGGPAWIEWENKEVEKMLQDRLKKAGVYTQSESSNYKIMWSDEWFISELVAHHQSVQDMKKACKTKTMITLIQDDGTEGLFSYKVKFNPSIELQLISKHGDKLVKIWNKEYSV